MKRRFYLLVCIILSLCLLSCKSNTTVQSTTTTTQSTTTTTTVFTKGIPEWYGNTSVERALNYGKTFDPMSGLEVWANQNDISDYVLYTIYDENNKEVSEISLNFSATYTVKYYIPETATIKKSTFERVVKVGTGIRGEYDEENLSYELVWEDNFDGTTLDTTKWNYEIGTGSGGWGNNELQYYTNSTKNCYVENGFLNIKAIKEVKNNSQYTSARITTAHKGDFKYGIFEARIKVPSGRGIWPAFWMMPTESKYGIWPKSGEIDIMEHVGYNPYYIHSTVHNELYNGGNGQQKGSAKVFEDIYTEYHVYKVVWLPDKLVFYCDDTIIFSYSPTNKTQKNWPYDQKFFMILNVAVGGNWGGVQGVDNSIFPQVMSIDYVRVYQAKELAGY